MGSRGQDTTIPDTVLEGPSGAASTLAIRWVFPSEEGLLTRLEPKQAAQQDLHGGKSRL